MNSAQDFSRFSAEQLYAQLSVAFQQVLIFPNKCVYLTNHGIRALSETEVRTERNAERINPDNQKEALALIMKGLKIQPRANNTLEQISQTFAGILQNSRVASTIEARAWEGKETSVLDSGRLKHTAEVQGFGYKKANLDQVAELSDEDFGSYKIEVPAYAGISSPAVQRLLKRKCGLNVVKRWESIIEKHFPPNRPEIKAEVMRSKKFSPEFFMDCALLRQDIANAFALLVTRVEEEGGVDALFDVNNVTPIIRGVQQQNERLMVRSTGKEDTVELANAGGNTSVPNVTTASEDVLRAISDVVTSYFGEKSLKQRLGANDPSLFEPTPLTPVLIQRMIGEKTPTATPLCGVMLTEDPESRVVNAPPGSEPSGNSIFQVAYGHNEAVVNGLIPVDTYYVNKEGALFPIIRPKTHRMVPTDKSGELRLEENSLKKAFTATLSKPAIDTLKAFSRRLEQFYGRPMDVEFVISGNTIYIVQVRPIVHNDSAAASYIPDLKKLGDAKTLKGSAIGAAGGGIRLAQSHEIITAATMSDALDKYQECEDPSSIKAIIVEKMAPSTSHWATIFRNEGKPVIHIDTLTTVESWLEDPEAYFLISPQQGLVAHLGATASTLEELQANGTCVNGWVDYPAAPLFSSCPQFQPTERLTDDTIRYVYSALKYPTNWANFQQHAAKVNLQEVFEAVRTAQGEQLDMSLAMLLFSFKHTLDQRSRGLPPDAEQQRRTEALQSQALALVRSIKQNGEFPPNHPNYGRKLLPIHFLKALVYSQPRADEVVDGDSLALDLREIQEEQRLTRELQKEGITLTNPYSLSLLRLGRFATTPEIAQRYRDYVISLDRSGRRDLLQDLVILINALDKLDMLVAWLNIVFPSNPDIRVHLEAFRRQVPLFKTLAEKRQKLKALNVSAFGDKKSFHTQWKVLKSELLDYVASDAFAEAYKNADVMGKLAMHALMYQVVDRFDLSIKALEGGSKTEFTMEEKLNLFQGMLKEYYGLLDRWFNNFDLPNKINPTSACLEYFKGFDLPPNIANRTTVCLEMIHKAIFKSNLDPSDLRFSKDFDLMAFGSLSGASFVSEPQSLEDGFSALHRELLTMLNLIFQQVSNRPIPMPPLLERVTTELRLGRAAGIELNAHGMTAYYTRTLREHGVQYRVNQPVGSESLTLSVRFSAQNEMHRWDRIAHCMLLLKIQGKFDVTDIELTSEGVGYTFHLDDNDNLDVLRELLFKFEQFSTEAPDLGSKAKIPDISVFKNDKKGLVPWMDDRRIVQEFERGCGMESMLSNTFLLDHLKRAILEDPSFGEAFLKRAWLADLNEDVQNHTDSTLPLILVKAGHAIEHAIAPIAERARYLLNTEKHSSLGIRVLQAVAEQYPQAIPEGCNWVRGILRNLESGIDYKITKALLDHLTKRGPPESMFGQALISALLSPERERCEEGIAMLEQLLDYYPDYLTPALKDALHTAAADSRMDQGIRKRLIELMS